MLKNIAVVALACTLASGCSFYRWFVHAEGELCCGGELGWLAMPKGPATLGDARLVFIQASNEFAAVRRDLERAEASGKFADHELRAFRDAVSTAALRREEVSAIGAAWSECESRCAEPSDWRAKQVAFNNALAKASRLASRTYARMYPHSEIMKVR